MQTAYSNANAGSTSFSMKSSGYRVPTSTLLSPFSQLASTSHHAQTSIDHLSSTSKRKKQPLLISIEMIENEEKEPLTFDKLEKCKLTVKQIEPENKKISKQAFQDAEFWFRKGFSMQRQKGVDVALDYYLQGIRIDATHYPCVLNLACVYSQLDKHANARKWFDFARKVNPLSIDAYYGSALSYFKMK